MSVFDNVRKREFQLTPSQTSATSNMVRKSIEAEIDVTNGRFNLKFVVPKDISYGGKRARISSYAVSSTSGASGYVVSNRDRQHQQECQRHDRTQSGGLFCR